MKLRMCSATWVWDWGLHTTILKQLRVFVFRLLFDQKLLQFYQKIKDSYKP